MSELLYTFGELDNRVRPFVFFVRAWAKEFDIIQSYPSVGLSNFMMTCLAIFFLQQLQKPILPPANAFLVHREISENVQYITDSSKLNFESKNTSTLAQLLAEFFDFYSSFDFNKNAISILYGATKSNNGKESMYIYNPLESGLNVSRIVSDFERNNFMEKCKLSRDVLTNSQIDAVELLLFYNRMIKRDYMGKSNKSGTTSFNIKSIMNPH